MDLPVTKTKAARAEPARKGRPPRGADPLDQELGERVRQRRVLLGWSCRELGEAVGVSLQQIRRYELGADRMSAGTFLRICVAMGVGLSDLCAGLEDGTDCRRPVTGLEGPTAQIARDFAAIREPAVRSQLARLVSAMAARSGAGGKDA